jgi:plastocyanin
MSVSSGLQDKARPAVARRWFQQTLLVLPVAWIAGLPGAVQAHGNQAHAARDPKAPREQKPWGVAGEPSRVRRTVVLRMNDRMRFVPSQLDIALGETLRLRVHNDGKVMKKFPGMEHDEPWMAHVPPGRSGDLVWHFNREGTFHFACLIAGHYEAGMRGIVKVSRP